MVGQNIGKYRVLDRVGRGGMGTVYRALDETLHREVAIKVLNAELDDPEVARRFRAEAITVARLSHPGIATIYELFEHDGQWLMVMEFVRGETLEQLVGRTGALAADQAAALCMQGLAALAHAHSMGVVHRDLKPANIMRTDAGDVKIMDFGIARVSGTEHLTTVGFMMGTPAYMAPEQVVGGEIDARADLYAIGVVFFRLLTGQLPFRGDTPFAMAQAQVNAPPTQIGELRQDLPPWVSEVLTRALQKKPEDRFQTATVFHDALEQAVTGGSTPSTSKQPKPTPGPPPMAGRRLPTGGSEQTIMPTPAAMWSGGLPADGRTPRAGDASGSRVAPPPEPSPRAGAPAPVPRAPVAPVAAQPRAARVAPAGGPLIWAGVAVTVLLLAGGVWWMLAPGPEAPVPDALVEDAGMPRTEVVRSDQALEPSPAPPAGNTTASAASGAAARGSAPAPAAVPELSAAAPPPAASEPEPAADTWPPVEVADVKVLVVDGRKAIDHDVTLNLGNGRIVAVSVGDGTPLVTWPYASVTGATYVHARNPRWNAALASPPDGLDVGGMFRSSRHYLALQNPSEYVILRLEDVNVIQVIRELELRTGLVIRRVPEGTAGASPE